MRTFIIAAVAGFCLLTGLSLSAGAGETKAKIEKAGGFNSVWQPLAELTPASTEPLRPPMQTLQILGGRKEKIRAGDVLGALTKDLGFAAAQVGKISVNEFSTYVAVDRAIAQQAVQRLNAGRIKGKSVKVRLLED